MFPENYQAIDKEITSEVLSNLEDRSLQSFTDMCTRNTVEDTIPSMINTSNEPYYKCSYCPYMTILEEQLKNHINGTHPHKKPSELFQLHCPACPNVFVQNISLESHLIHDHYLLPEHLSKVMETILSTRKCAQYVQYVSCANQNISENIIEKRSSKEPAVNQTEVSNNKTESLNDHTAQATVSLLNDVNAPENQVAHAEKLLQLTHEVNALTDISVINDPLTNELTFIENNAVEGNQDDIETADTMDTSQDDYPETSIESTTEFVTLNQSVASQTISRPQTRTLPEYSFASKKYRCNVGKCKLQMQEPTKLQYHMKCHDTSDQNKFTCPECKIEMSNWKSTAGHLLRVHQIDMEALKCEKCDYRTHSYSILMRQHMPTHGDDRPFSCVHCKKGFKNKKQLKNHTHRTHSEKAKEENRNRLKDVFHCKECDKPFSRSRQMKIHVDTVHKKIRTHACSVGDCVYTTSNKGALTMHRRLHSGEKPFKCDNCAYSTADHNSLRRHKLRHSGNKPYKCPHCDYESIQSSTYKMHIKMKHPGLDKQLLFSCALCNFRSVNSIVYSGHMHSQHPESVEKEKNSVASTPTSTESSASSGTPKNEHHSRSPT